MLRRVVLGVIITVTSCAPMEPVRPSMTAQSLIDVGTLHLRQGALADAGAAFSMALELSPIPEALDGLGCVHLLNQEWDQAEAFFKRALEVDPSYTRALSNLALLYEVSGDTTQAEAYYREAIAAEGENFKLRNNFAAFLHDKEREHGRTEHLLRQAKAIAPHPIIQKNLEHLEGER